MSVLKSYEDIVSTLRRHAAREMITNGSASHAAVLIRNILMMAYEKRLPVRIYSGSLSPEVYNELVALAEKVLEVAQVDAICDVKPSPDNAFARLLAGAPNATLSVLGDEASRFASHFVLAGDCAYRVEVDHDACGAIGNFNDESVGKRLQAIFGDLVTTAIPASNVTAPAHETAARA